MKKLILMNEWVFHIYTHKGGKGLKVVMSNVDRRDREFARRLARMIEVRLARASPR